MQPLADYFGDFLEIRLRLPYKFGANVLNSAIKKSSRMELFFARPLELAPALRVVDILYAHNAVFLGYEPGAIVPGHDFCGIVEA